MEQEGREPLAYFKGVPLWSESEVDDKLRQSYSTTEMLRIWVENDGFGEFIQDRFGSILKEDGVELPPQKKRPEPDVDGEFPLRGNFYSDNLDERDEWEVSAYDDSWWQSWKKSGFDLDHFRKTLPIWAVLLLVVIVNFLFWFIFLRGIPMEEWPD